MQADYQNLVLTADNYGEWKVETGTHGVNALCNLNTFYYDWYYPHCHTHVIQDSTKKAFSIAKNLMDKKLVVCKTVKHFVDLVDIIGKEL